MPDKVRLMPHDLELEKSVLGILMRDEDGMVIVSSFLTPGMFYAPKHRQLYKVIEALFESGNPIDSLTVHDRAKELDVLNAVGGPAYIVGLSDNIVSGANVEYHARIIKSKWESRELLKATYKLQDELYKDQPASVAIEGLEKTLINVQSDSVTRVETGAKVMKDLKAKATIIHDRGGEMVGEPFFGIPQVDRMFGGWEPADVIAFGGRPKSGKSSISNNIHGYHVENNVPLFSASGEMMNVRAGARLAAYLSGMPTRGIEKGDFFKTEWDEEKFDLAYKQVQDSKLFFYDGQLSVPILRKLVHFYYSLHGVERFLFDRIGLFKEVVEARDDYKARMTVAAGFRALANELGVSFCIYSQLGTDVERSKHKRGEAKHLFGGIGVQANVTKAALIYRPDMYGDMVEFQAGPHEGTDSHGMAELYTVLNNYDELGSEILRFDGPCQCFRGDDWLPEEGEDNKNDKIPF